MSRKDDRIAVVNDIIEAAQNYRDNLVGKVFLFIFDGGYVEAIFKKEDFKHLTGVESYLSAKDFYKLSIRRHLKENQIWFSSVHPYNLCRRKLLHLNKISLLTTNDSFMLDELITDSQTYKFGATNMDFTICFNYQKNDSGNIISTTIHAESLRDEDCFAKSVGVYEVTHVFSKKNNERFYNKLEFSAKEDILSGLQDEVKALISESILSTKQ